MSLKTFANTSYFSEAANDFKRNGGVYTKAPKGTLDYKEYWAEHKRRCLEGYSVGDTRITGRHYFYLNFCPIKKTAKKEEGTWNVMRPKELLFPSFWAIDYDWWWAKEIAMKGMSKEEVAKLQIEGLPIKDYTEGKNLCCLKARRAGFSYKEAADGVYNYNFIANSKSYYFASKREYLTVDGILNKVTDYLSHLDTNTQNYWRKNRMEHNTMLHRKASYYDKNKDPRGYKSEIIGVIIDDPDKVRGKDGIKITYEEAGSFKNLKAALEISVPSTRDGATMTGQISVFGTGGEEGPDIEGLEEIFSEPEAYDMLEFNNIWESGMEDTVCGYFVPCTKANESFMDADGNIDMPAVTAFDDARRAKKKKLRDPKQLDRVIAEFPRNPSEALNRLSSTIMPVAEAQAQLRKVEKNIEIQSAILHGVLFQGPRKVEFRPSNQIFPILKYPHKNDDKLEGGVSIFFPPDKDRYGVIQENRYITVVDPYYKDQAEDKTSLWAAYVIKQKSFGDAYGDTIVANYIGRPEDLHICYRNTVLLAKMYNSKIQSEIAGGGQGLFSYLKQEKLLSMACSAPRILTNKEDEVVQKNRTIFMNISTGEKKNGFSYIANWLCKVRGLNEHGEPVLNIHMIYDVGLLREIIKYNPDPKKNFDRLSALCVGMYMLQEQEAFTPKKEEPMSPSILQALYSEEYHRGNEDNNTYVTLDQLLMG